MKRLIIAALVATSAVAFAQNAPETEDRWTYIEIDRIDMSPEEAAEEYERITDGARIKLWARYAVEDMGSYRRSYGPWRSFDEECAFDSVDGVTEVHLPSGTNHLLIYARIGTPEAHAANMVACEYSPVVSGNYDESLPMFVSVRGCYLAHDVSIPTARQIKLYPLPAEACGF